MASCGISLNLSSLESSISGHIETAISFAGMSGIPFLPSIIDVAIAISSGNILAAVKIIVPADSLDGLWKGLRDEFALAFALPGVPSNIPVRLALIRSPRLECRDLLRMMR